MYPLLTILLAVTAFPLSQVRLTDSRWRDNMSRDSAWVCSISSQQALHNFRTTVGLYSALEGGYDTMQKMGGWESPDCDLRGHAVGHLLSAYSLLFAATGDSLFYLKGDSVVQGIRTCQRVGKTGYVSAFPEGLIDRNIQGQSVWAPWYTLHKVMAGMLNQYTLCGNDTALAVVHDFARWADRKTVDLSEETRLLMLRNEFGGMPEVWLDLYALTGDSVALQLADFFYDTRKLDPLYQGDFDMGTMHTNTFLPKVIAEQKRGTDMPRHFFREMLAHHVMAPGILSDKEHFFAPGTMHRHLSAYTGETCCTYNMLRLARALYSDYPDDASYMQYIEQALVNDILGQQDPESGMVHYFLPMQTGAYKLYSTPMQSFWCCVGSSFESHAKYGENIYWHNQTSVQAADTVLVNLWIPSVLDAPELGLRLRQITDFPRSNTTTLVVEQAPRRRITLRIRVDSTYRTISRRLRVGERITVSRDFKLHTEAADGDSTRVALFYGPILLAGRLGHVENPFSNPTHHNDYYTYDYQVPDSIRSIRLRQDAIRPVPGSFAEFVTEDGIRISPLYDIHHERYVVYWNE